MSMIKWFRRNRCDVISTHSSTDSWLAALAMLALGRPFPIVRTRHISAPVPTNLLTRWLYTGATSRIVTAGEALRKELIERNGFPAARIDSVPTGIDTARFRPGDRNAARKSLGLPAGRPLVGIVATLRSWKGHLYLIEAFAGLPKTVSLVIVGDGPMRPQLEARVDKLGLRERTVFAGNRTDVVPWLQAVDLFALALLCQRGRAAGPGAGHADRVAVRDHRRGQHRRGGDRRQDRAGGPAEGRSGAALRAGPVARRRRAKAAARRSGARALRGAVSPTRACSTGWRRSTARRAGVSGLPGWVAER